MSWTHFDRFNALLAGELPDRPAVAAWRHFIPEETDVASLAQITIDYTTRHDWDWVKINPRGSYWPEVWGHVYDYSTYLGPGAKLTGRRIASPADLALVEVADPTTPAPLAEQLDLVRQIRAGLPDRPIVQTLFSPLGVLLVLALGQDGEANGPIGPESRLARVVREAGAPTVHKALAAIAQTQAAHVAELLKAGADGVFYAVLRTAHPSASTAEEFATFSEPYDRIVLESIGDAARLFHTCGPLAAPARFTGYPIQALHWDQQAEGNPDLDLVTRPTVIGGVSNEALGANDKEAVAVEAARALALKAGRPFFLAPACATPLNVTDETLDALREAVD